MRRLEVGLEVGAPAEAVWSVLADLSEWPRWGPSVRRAVADGDRVAPGMSGVVTTVVGVRLPFRITEVVPGRAWRWRVAGVPATGHVVRPLGPARCWVTFDVPWPFAPYLAVLWLGLRRVRAVVER